MHPFWCLMSSMKPVVIAGRLVALMVEPASQWAMCRRRDTTRNKKGRNQRTLRTHGPISRLFALWSSAQSPAQSGCCWAAVNICSLDLCWHSFPGLTWHRTPRPRISMNISEFWYVLMNLVVSNVSYLPTVQYGNFSIKRLMISLDPRRLESLEVPKVKLRQKLRQMGYLGYLQIIQKWSKVDQLIINHWWLSMTTDDDYCSIETQWVYIHNHT